MKQCPVCKSVFPPDNDYCLLDGNPLVFAPDAGPRSHSGNVPTQVIPQAHATAGGTSSNTLLYLVIGALGALVLAGGAILLWVVLSKPTKVDVTNNSTPPVEQRPVTAESAIATQTPKAIPATPAMPAQTTVSSASTAGRWTGDWSSPSGAYLTVVFNLNDSGGGRVDGSIEWTLRRTRRPDKISKIGLSATEYVSGQFDPMTRKLELRGTRKDDPNDVLVMVDSYRLSLSNDERRLSGRARNGGAWNASVNLAR